LFIVRFAFCRFGFIETNVTDGESMCALHWKIQICRKNAIIQPARKQTANVEPNNPLNCNAASDMYSSPVSQNSFGQSVGGIQTSDIPGQDTQPLLGVGQQGPSNGMNQESPAKTSRDNFSGGFVNQLTSHGRTLTNDVSYKQSSLCEVSAPIPPDLPPLEPIGSYEEDAGRSHEHCLPAMLPVDKRDGSV
jgi:hypothetical protein